MLTHFYSLMCQLIFINNFISVIDASVSSPFKVQPLLQPTILSIDLMLWSQIIYGHATASVVTRLAAGRIVRFWSIF